MKTPSLFPFAAIILLTASGCDKQSPEIAKRLAELEQRNQQAAERQRQLEQELEDQKLAVERDAIERERVRIEEDRAELERQQGEAAAEQDEAIRQREEALARREGKLEQFQSNLEEKEADLHQRGEQLSEADRELAGCKALAFEDAEQSEPVGDYGMFYDSLSSYGSWFETPDYGYVWQPVCVRDSNWRPYSRGRWACSDRGWTWVSEEPFGWATYHYGRWALLRGRGWIWVPGTEWAPCWVSWRESGSHIGWAPLPPETLAYRGHHWNSSVDVRFGISAWCFSFVEIQHFGRPAYRHCLPHSGNNNWFQQTINITNIYIHNRKVVCGGPHYKKVCDRIGKQLPFYRLEVDHHPRVDRGTLGMRPRVRGNHLVVSAPNIDADWNEGLSPQRLKGRLENISVERNGELEDDMKNRYRQSREEGRKRADRTITELGGPEQLAKHRDEKLPDNRRQADDNRRKEESRELAENPRRQIPAERLPAKLEREPARESKNDPKQVLRNTNENRVRPEVMERRENPREVGGPRVTPPQETPQQPDSRPQRQENPQRVAPDDDTAREARNHRQEETRREQQRQSDQAREAHQDGMKRRQEELAEQRQRQEKQREAEQERDSRKQAAEQEREQRRQQEEARERQQERAQREQQEAQQREAQREQERARERQEEQARQRQQAERQRQQEENQRQQEQARQKQEKDQEEQRKRR